jgi:hypothetical protein
MTNQFLQHFRAVCEKEFGFLIEEYEFTPAPLPAGEFVNEFQCRLSNGMLTLVVEGVAYGRDAMVSMEDNCGRSVGIACLLPGWAPFAKPKKRKEKNRLDQDQQIAQAAQQLREHGQDILNGDLERFNKIGDRINSIMKRFEEEAREASLSSPEQRVANAAASEAGHAFKRGDYALVAKLLEPHLELLPPSQRKRYEVARQRAGDA